MSIYKEQEKKLKLKRLSVDLHAASAPVGIFLILVTTFAVTLAISGCKPEGTARAVDRLPEKTPVIAKQVSRISVNRIISVSGTLVADKTAPLSFQVPGKIDQVFVDEGDRVTRGMLLATVESQDYRSRLEMAKAAVLRAKDAYERYEPLYREGAFAEKNFIELKAGLAEVQAARNIEEKALKETRLYSPISGIVGRKSIELGQMVSAQAPAFTIVKTDVIYALVSVPESEIDQVIMGKDAQVAVSALQERIFNGEVSMIGAVADEQTRTYAVKVELENQDFVLRPGMIVRTDIHTDRKVDMLAIPGVAIVRDADDLTYVFVVDSKSGTAHRRRVVPGRAYGDEIEIRDGIQPEDSVVISGQNKLSDGIPISVLKADSSVPSVKEEGA